MPIEEMEKIWMNGALVPWGEAKVHVLSHALHYGSGVFEGIRCYKTVKGSAVFRLREHLRRLERSAKLYYMPVPYSLEELVRATHEVIRANGLEACYIRPLVFRGYGEMGIFPMNAPVDAIIAVWPWGAYLGEEGVRRGIRAKVSSIQALDHTSLARAAKASGHYLNSILAKVEVTSCGYDEAIMLNEHGHVAEGSGENIFVVYGRKLITPPLVDGALAGLTRDSVMVIARDEGYEVVEASLNRTDLYLADEAFFTGTAAEMVPLVEVDDRKVGRGVPGPVSRQLLELFQQALVGKLDRYKEWNEYVHD